MPSPRHVRRASTSTCSLILSHIAYLLALIDLCQRKGARPRMAESSRSPVVTMPSIGTAGGTAPSGHGGRSCSVRAVYSDRAGGHRGRVCVRKGGRVYRPDGYRRLPGAHRKRSRRFLQLRQGPSATDRGRPGRSGVPRLRSRRGAASLCDLHDGTRILAGVALCLHA
jgi:hypothetical protein